MNKQNCRDNKCDIDDESSALNLNTTVTDDIDDYQEFYRKVVEVPDRMFSDYIAVKDNMMECEMDNVVKTPSSNFGFSSIHNNTFQQPIKSHYNGIQQTNPFGRGVNRDFINAGYVSDDLSPEEIEMLFANMN